MRTPRMLALTIVTVGLLTIGAVRTTPAGADPTDDLAFVQATLVDIHGDDAGQVLAFDDGDTTQWLVLADGLTPGLHGLQLHATGDCDAPFDGIGARIASVALPSIAPDGSGEAGAVFSTPSAGLAALDDGDELSVTVHAAPDNGGNVPTRYQSSAATVPGPDAQTTATHDAGAPVLCGEASDVFGGRSVRNRTAAQARMADAIRARLARVTSGTDVLQADLVDGTGTPRGRVRLFSAADDGQQAVITEAAGLDPGRSSIQLHATGACTGSGFTGAGARISGTDLPDLLTAATPHSPSVTSATFPSADSLVAGDGTAVIIHAGADNHANLPTRYSVSGGATGPDATTTATHDAGAGVLCGTLRPVPAVERFVDAIYGWLLQRPVEPSAVTRWTAYLASHSRNAFTNAVIGTREYRRTIVTLIYEGFLGTEPDRAGLDYWSARLAKPRASEESLIVAILGTSRYYDAVGGTDEDFVDDLYLSNLDRDPTDGELALCTAYLARGGSRSALAAQVRSTRTGRASIIEAEYFTLIQRDATAPEIAIWIAYLERGGRIEGLRAFLLSSPDFYALAQDNPYVAGSPFLTP